MMMMMVELYGPIRAPAPAMASFLAVPLTPRQVQVQAPSSSHLCSKCMLLSPGCIFTSRFPNISFTLPHLKSHRKTGIALAVSTDAGNMERSASIQFGNNATVTSEPLGTTQLKVTVNLNSKATRRAFDSVLENLRRSAPPVEGFRKLKGGKSDIPREVLYRMMGPKTVDKFIIEEIVSSSVLEYVEKEGLKVKNDFKTVQSTNELAGSFKAGKDFAFDAIVDLEESEDKDSESLALNLDGSELEAVVQDNET